MTFAVLSGIVLALAVTVGAFASVAHAQEYDFQPLDGGSYDWQPLDGGSYDWQPLDNGNYDWQPLDNGSYDWQPLDNGNYDWQPLDNGNYDWQPLDYCDSCTYDDSGIGYSYETYDVYDTYSQPYSSGYSYAAPMTFRPPQYASGPSYSQPSRPAQQQQQQQQQQQSGGQPINISNVNTNVNTNTNVAPVAQAVAQPLVQYVYPQTYSYPVYTPTYTYPNYNYNYAQAPFCSISVTGGYGTGMVGLTWTSSGATYAYISPVVGNVAPNGSTSFYAYGNNVYTLTVSGPGGSYTCRTQSYIAPVTPYVSLSQIPYTGFDFGPLGNAMYWMSLMAFAVAGAYLIVYYKGGAMVFASNMLSRRTSTPLSASKSEVTVSHVAAPVAAPAPVESKAAAPAALANLPTMASHSTKDSMSVARVNGVPRIVINRA